MRVRDARPGNRKRRLHAFLLASVMLMLISGLILRNDFVHFTLLCPHNNRQASVFADTRQKSVEPVVSQNTPQLGRRSRNDVAKNDDDVQGRRIDAIKSQSWENTEVVDESFKTFWEQVPVQGWKPVGHSKLNSLNIFPNPMVAHVHEDSRCFHDGVCCLKLSRLPVIDGLNNVGLAQYFHDALDHVFSIRSVSVSLYNIRFEVNSGIELPPAGANEAYSLLLTDQMALIRAETTAGAIHGFWTWVAAFTPGMKGAPCFKSKIGFPLFIRDEPRFEYRSFMLDAARSMYSVNSIKQVIDMMARVKLNVLHFRLTDDTAFCLQNSLVSGCKSGCAADELKHNPKTYSDQELRELVKHARFRGIRIVPEIDVPGHAQGWGPTLTMKCDGVRHWGVPLAMQKNETYEALESVLRQVNSIFSDPLLHLGGDEVSYSCIEKESGGLCKGFDQCIHYFEEQLRNMLNRLPKPRSPIRWMDLMERHGKHRGFSPLFMNTSQYFDLHMMSWRGFSEVLALTGAVDHWATVNVQPLQNPMIFTSEGWYIPPRIAKEQGDMIKFGCHKCFDTVYKSPWGTAAKNLFEALTVNKKMMRLPDAAQRRVIGGTIAAFEVSHSVLISIHSWSLVCAVSERLWSSGDVDNATDALNRLRSNVHLIQWGT